jgi:AcrR family transcriptional regulator
MSLTIHSVVRVRRRAAIARQAGPVGRPKVRTDDEQMAIIVDVAMDLFLEHGYAEMKMADVAARCAISKRTLYRLYPGKVDLFRALVELHRGSMLHFPPGLELRPLDEALAEIFRIDLDDLSDERRRLFVTRAVEESRQTPEIGDILHQHGGERAKGQLADWLSTWKPDSIGNLENPFAAASILMDMVFGAVMLRQLNPLYWPGCEDRRAYLRECIRCFVKGAIRA